MAGNVKQDGGGGGGVPGIYKPSIKETNSSVQTGSGNSQASGKAKARYPDEPLDPYQTDEANEGKMKTRAFTPGGPTGS